MMTQPEQKIALAEWMGWKIVKQASLMMELTCLLKPDGHTDVSDEEEFDFDSVISHLPDYPNDLNACHEVEVKLDLKLPTPPHKDSIRTRYVLKLKEMCGEYGASIATSQQRTEALCRTLFPERFA